MINICMHRGDYSKKRITIKDSSSSLLEFDEIYFTVKKSADYEEYIFQKKLSNGDITLDDDGTYLLEIQPEDTNDLECRDYAFDIEVVSKNPKIKRTFLGVFNLLKEVTYASNEGG